MGRHRNIAPRDLVLALRTGFDPGQAMRDRVFDRLIITELEVQKRVVLDGAPMPAIERVRADEVDRSRNEAARPFGQDEQNAIGHGLAGEQKNLALKMRAAPLAGAGLNVEGEERVPDRLGQIGAGEPKPLSARRRRIAALAADELAFTRRKRAEEILERAI